jgi:Tfp pilus assembly protein PilV
MHLQKTNRGQLLLEALITMSVMVLVLALGAQVYLAGANSGKASIERNVGQGLAEGELEAVRAASDEKWNNLYKPPTGSGNPTADKGVSNPYYAQVSSGKWIFVSGMETVAVNNISFSRYFTIEDVSRDSATRNIETIYNSSNDDPSTQKVTVTVSWPNADAITLVEYFTRWRNKVCNQTDWSGGASSGVKNCPDTTYDSKDASLDTSGGQVQLQ